MALSEDLISFDIIENQKENIQSLPQGRSAKALAASFGGLPSIFSPQPTLSGTRSLNDAIRQEYEMEVQQIADADDPLDVYDRYVKWTINAYPTAQATPESQLRTLLERATKAFQSAAQYKNDVRYLKLWLMYVHFFSDAPREVFAYLSRHAIGEGLGLYYEEFAAWLECAGRWTQAEEVYKLGIEKEARPAERLLRKFGEFQRRFEARPQDANEPSSPALPAIRPALAAKLDPFASSTGTPRDPQAQQLPPQAAPAKSARSKMAIFSDADGSASRPSSGGSDTSKGWGSIGTIAERRKENVTEARAWNGETLKAGKKATGPKMMVFKDQSTNVMPDLRQPVLIQAKNGKSEVWFADILSICPNPDDPGDEYCVEELRARQRGWLDKTWPRQDKGVESRRTAEPIVDVTDVTPSMDATVDDLVDQTQNTLSLDDTMTGEVTREMHAEKKSKSKSKKTLEIRGATQTVKTIFESPTGPKIKRKKFAEPTMTLHTKAATDEILDIFNQPLRNVGLLGSAAESDGESEYDADDYTRTSMGDNTRTSVSDGTRTGNVSGATSEIGDEVTEEQTESVPDVTQPDSVSPWSDFTSSKHVPQVADAGADTTEGETGEVSLPIHHDVNIQPKSAEEEWDIATPTEEKHPDEPYTRFISTPPEDVELPNHPYRSAEEAAQSRLPFMTPIVEQTEFSMGLPTIRPNKQHSDTKTPSRRKDPLAAPTPELMSSPFQEIINESRPRREEAKPAVPVKAVVRRREGGPIIKDSQCNPCDESVRQAILEQTDMPLTSFPNYHDYRPSKCNKGVEVRRFVKALQKSSKGGADKTSTNLSLPPTLHFPASPDLSYTLKRELGKGGFAPVYLFSSTSTSEGDAAESLVAVKSESPPTAWEFYILSILHHRLAQSAALSRNVASLTVPHSFHHFQDEVYLLESYHDQGTLLDLVNIARSDSTSSASSGPGLDECVAMFFAVELLRTLAALHAVGILHGDIKADNCLVRLSEPPPSPSAQSAPTPPDCSPTYDPDGSHGWASRGVVLIDFGRAIDARSFRAEVGFLADWKTDGGDCVEMRELRPWTHQIDYWGAAGVLHVLLFGKWIEDVAVETDNRRAAAAAAAEIGGGGGGGDGTGGDGAVGACGVGVAGIRRRKLKEPLKRYWQAELWADVFDALMNPAAWVRAEHPPRLPCTRRLEEVRTALERWLVENGERRGLRAQLQRLDDRIRDRKR